MSDLVVPFVIHWDGEPEPDLTGIDNPVRVPFQFVPFESKGGRQPKIANEDATRIGREAVALRFQTVANADRATQVVLPDGTPVVDPATGRALMMPGFVSLEGNVLTGLALQGMAATAPATREVILYFFFRQGGLMDYQRTGVDGPIPYEANYRDFGNYNFGLVGAAAGYSLQFLLVMAGRYNRKVNPKSSDNSFGLPDRNEKWIRAGYADFQAHVLGHL
ncbi:MAG: hypothetical protein J0H14_01720 [Alphaproteobacteria bacterium]|nr:hypothetical protein [Alphaproteobacteria bacterium]